MRLARFQTLADEPAIVFINPEDVAMLQEGSEASGRAYGRLRGTFVALKTGGILSVKGTPDQVAETLKQAGETP